jgi:hypothetical protein
MQSTNHQFSFLLSLSMLLTVVIAGADQILPEFRLHGMTQWVQRVALFHGT